MNISSASAQSGLPAKTIRYYEEVDLIRPARDPSGYRQFTQQDLRVLSFLSRVRALGFSIDDCRGLLALWESDSRTCADVRDLAGRHLNQIEEKIRDLTLMRDELAELVQCCAGDNAPDCALLNRLDG